MNIVLIPIPTLNIYGAAISSIVSQIIGYLINYKALKKKLDISFKITNYSKIILASLVMGAVAYSVYSIGLAYVKSNMFSTLLSVITSSVFYIYVILNFKVIDKETLAILPFGGRAIKYLEKKEAHKAGKERIKNRRKRNKKH